MKNEKNSFILGLAIGVALVSLLGFLIMAAAYFTATYDPKNQFIDPRIIASFLMLDNTNFQRQKNLLFQSIFRGQKSKSMV